MPTGFQRFSEQFRAWWPILTVIVGISIAGVVNLARAANAIDDHEARLDVVERTANGVDRRLTIIEVQTQATGKAVDRMEDKIDRVLEAN